MTNANVTVPMMSQLIGVGQATHARHDAEDIVVVCIHEQCACFVGSECDTVKQAGQEGHVEGGIVDTRHVAAAGWLVLLWLQGKAVHVNSVVWNVSVVLVWLNQIEVTGIALGKAIMSIQLQLSGNHGVSSSVSSIARSSTGNSSGCEVGPLVLGLSNLQSRNPNQLLDWVIVVQSIFSLGPVRVSSPVNWTCSIKYS
jgi:hypothetical protein